MHVMRYTTRELRDVGYRYIQFPNETVMNQLAYRSTIPQNYTVTFICTVFDHIH